MTTRIKNLLLFLWRMFYPLILYHIIVSSVMYLAIILVIGCGISGMTYIPDTLFNELNNQLSLLLTGLGAIFASIPLGILYVLFLCQQDTDCQQAVTARPVHLHMNLRQALRIIALGFSLCICVNALLLTLPFSWDTFDEVGDLLYTPSLLHQFLCVGLIVPFAEELVFRGLGYGKMRLMLPVKPAVIISALYFGIYHGNLLQGIYATILGMVLAWIMESYGALSAAYLLHASANVMSILISNTVAGIFLYVFTLRCGLILICGGAALFILYKIREDRLDYETSVDCNSML